MAAQLKSELNIVAELVVGNAGELTIWVDDRKVAEKSGGRFPEPAAVAMAVRSALAS